MVKTRKQRSEDWHSKSLKMTSGAALADFGIQKCFTLRASTSTIEIRGTGEAPRGRGPEKVKQETRPMKMEKGNLHLARLINYVCTLSPFSRKKVDVEITFPGLCTLGTCHCGGRYSSDPIIHTINEFLL